MRELLASRAIWPRGNVSPFFHLTVAINGANSKIKGTKSISLCSRQASEHMVLKLESWHGCCPSEGKHKRRQIAEMCNSPRWGLWKAAVDGSPSQMTPIIWADTRFIAAPSPFFFFLLLCNRLCYFSSPLPTGISDQFICIKHKDIGCLKPSRTLI